MVVNRTHHLFADGSLAATLAPTSTTVRPATLKLTRLVAWVHLVTGGWQPWVADALLDGAVPPKFKAFEDYIVIVEGE